jgi:hypothetical protein
LNPHFPDEAAILSSKDKELEFSILWGIERDSDGEPGE